MLSWATADRPWMCVLGQARAKSARAFWGATPPAPPTSQATRRVRKTRTSRVGKSSSTVVKPPAPPGSGKVMTVAQLLDLNVEEGDELSVGSGDEKGQEDVLEERQQHRDAVAGSPKTVLKGTRRTELLESGVEGALALSPRHQPGPFSTVTGFFAAIQADLDCARKQLRAMKAQLEKEHHQH